MSGLRDMLTRKVSPMGQYCIQDWAVGKAQVGYGKRKRKREKILGVARRWQILKEMKTALVLARVASTGLPVCLDAKTCAGRLKSSASGVQVVRSVRCSARLMLGGVFVVKLLPRQGRKGAAVKSAPSNQRASKCLNAKSYLHNLNIFTLEWLHSWWLIMD